MPRELQTLVYVGIKNSVVALDIKTGVEVWRTKLKGSDFVSVLWDGDALMAGNGGEVFRLDPLTGATIWRNPLKGLGLGLVTLASSRAADSRGVADASEVKRRRDQQAAMGAAAS